jgi:hypothetical protein
MAVTVFWVEYTDTESPGTTQQDTYQPYPNHSVTSASNLNFGSDSDRDVVPESYPVTAGYMSYAKYLRLQFSGNFTQISNARVWLSDGNYVTGEYIFFSGNVPFPGEGNIENGDPDAGGIAAPFVGMPDAEWTSYGTGRRIPTSQPTLPNVVLFSGADGGAGYRNTTATTLPSAVRAGYVDGSGGYYSGACSAVICFQLQTDVESPAGATNTKTISLSYDRQ